MCGTRSIYTYLCSRDANGGGDVGCSEMDAAELITKLKQCYLDTHDYHGLVTRVRALVDAAEAADRQSGAGAGAGAEASRRTTAPPPPRAARAAPPTASSSTQTPQPRDKHIAVDCLSCGQRVFKHIKRR